MAIGERIKYFRIRNNMTQKQLGEMLGFKGKTSDVRMAQYEAEARVPKDNLVNQMAHIFDISPDALTVPVIDTDIGLMHTFFALEDTCGLTIDETDDDICLRIKKPLSKGVMDISSSLRDWKKEKSKLNSGEITQEDYDQWRYKYPELDTTGRWKRIPSKELSDLIINNFKDKKAPTKEENADDE